MVKYGPEDCVSTWKSPESHCVVQTQCEGVNIDNFEFGLICVDNLGKPVRHMFGKGSFDAEETFDSLIPCQQCLGTEEMPENVMLNNEVLGLAKDVKDISGMMKTVSASIEKLNKAVFAKDEATVRAAPTTAAPVALHAQAHAQRKQTTHHLRHRVQQRRVREEAMEDSQDAQEDARDSDAAEETDDNEAEAERDQAQETTDSEDMEEEAQKSQDAAKVEDDDASQEQGDSSESQDEEAEQAEEPADDSQTEESA